MLIICVREVLLNEIRPAESCLSFLQNASKKQDVVPEGYGITSAAEL